MIRKRIALGIGANVIDQGALVIIQLLTVALLVRFWGAEGFGTWAMLTAVPAMLAIGDLGFGTAASVRMTMELARGEVGEAARTFRAAIRVVTGAALLIATFAALLGWLGAGLLEQSLPVLDQGELLILPAALGTYAIAVLFSGISQALFRSSGRFAQGMLLSTLTNCLESAFLFFAAGSGWGLAWSAGAWAAGRLAGVTLQWLIAARTLPGLTRNWLGPTDGRVRELLGPATAAISIPLSRILLLQGTVVALGTAAGAAVVPAFVAARTLSRIGLQGSQLLTTALMPEFGAASAQHKHEIVLRMVVLVLSAATAISLFFSAFLLVSGPWLIGIWSSGQISASAGLMAIMAASALLGGIWNPLSNLMLAVNRQATFAIAYAVVAVTGVAVTVVTAQWLDSSAAALALALTDMIMLVIVGRFVHRNWLAGSDFRSILLGLMMDGRALLFRRGGS